jgi:hypothetical protein
METITILVFLSCLISLIFLATVAWALIQINEQLAPIGGTSESFLAKLRLGLRAIEKQTSHLGVIVTNVNQQLEKIEGGLEQLANNLKK